MEEGDGASLISHRKLRCSLRAGSRLGKSPKYPDLGSPERVALGEGYRACACAHATLNGRCLSTTWGTAWEPADCVGVIHWWVRPWWFRRQGHLFGGGRMMPYAVRLRRVERGARCSGPFDGTLDFAVTMPHGEHPLTASLNRQQCREVILHLMPGDDASRGTSSHCAPAMSILQVVAAYAVPRVRLCRH